MINIDKKVCNCKQNAIQKNPEHIKYIPDLIKYLKNM